MMKRLFLCVMLLVSCSLVHAQKFLGKTKGDVLLAKSDCIFEFVNAFSLVAKCDTRYEEYEFNGGLKDSKNNKCSQESYEVDSTYIPVLKKNLKESFKDAQFHEVLKEKPARIKNNAGEKLKLPTEFIEAGGMIIEVMHGDAHGNTGNGIYTLVYYISIKKLMQVASDSTHQQKGK